MLTDSYSVTFAILGHNEEDSLGYAIDQARTAAHSQDSVMFVDSASTDRSIRTARRLGVQTICAPLGKGNAVRAAFDACVTEWIVLTDADTFYTEENAAAILRANICDEIDTVIGHFHMPDAPLPNTRNVFNPLLESLFPELTGYWGPQPLSGFRGVKPKQFRRSLPSGYGVETHLNLTTGLQGGVVKCVPLGNYAGKAKPHPEMAYEIAEALLDIAEVHGRIDSTLRLAVEDELGLAASASVNLANAF